MIADIPTQADLEPTAIELRSICLQIDQQNARRRAANRPELDRSDVLQRAIAQVMDDKFEGILKPYLHSAYKQFPGSPGVAGRLRQHIDVYQHAESALRRETGLKRPKPKLFNLGSFFRLYADGRLPLA
jgi:hypothetical protein